ncbi:MAG TPA: nitroreductase family protein, partial [Deltaproteobacteria bacterium]|nr:nitroreductase family protein [Deltaproteobacteria bacterium]
MKLADPRRAGDMSLEEAVFSRRTVRSFAPRPLSFDQFSQLLWAGQGSTDAGGFRRSSPSAGALYPIDLFAVVGRDTVEKVGAGLYLYESSSHTATLLLEGDHRDELAGAALSQFWMA